MKLWPHQARFLQEFWKLYQSGEKALCVTSPTGGGKCLAPGTGVMMFSGEVKPVEDINVGDLLMGPHVTLLTGAPDASSGGTHRKAVLGQKSRLRLLYGAPKPGLLTT